MERPGGSAIYGDLSAEQDGGQGHMFERILLPVDASSCAQDVVALGQALAARFGSSLLLLYVAGAPSSWPDSATAQAWLTSWAASLRAEGYSVDTLVRDNQGADALAAVAAQRDIDLIVLWRHAQDQVPRMPGLARPDISAQLTTRTNIPVLVMPPRVNAAVALRFFRDPLFTRRAITVALDGSERAEQALPLAIEMARGLHQHLHLVRVVPQIASDAPAGAASSIRRMAIQTLYTDVHDAHEYLAAVRRTIVGSTPMHVQKRVLIGDTVARLLEATPPTEVGLLVVTTHGRGALARAVMKSVTARLLQEARVPLVIVPPPKHNVRDRPDWITDMP
jgi:nucleotide-binding universal stress UspA family protein